MDTSALDRSLGRLASRSADWRNLDPAGRAALLRRCMDGVLAVAGDWAALSCRAKGIDPAAPLAGEEWLVGPMTTLRGFRLTAETLEDLDRPERIPLTAGPGGRAVARVFPASLPDRLFYLGVTGDIWLQPGAPPTRAQLYRSASAKPPVGAVALVLGAGNVASIGPLDVLSMLVAYDCVTLLKLNPVNEYLLPVFERAFEALIEPGYLALATGGGDAGDYLCQHETVSRIHLTGSRRTFDAIVWGREPEERAARRAADTPRVAKPFTAELGCVTPILVVPGSWSDSDLDFQARHVAAMVAHNASFNCVAGKVLVVARDWPQRQAFLDRVTRVLAETPPRAAYYPGAAQRYAAFLERYPQARAVGSSGPGIVPWTLIPDVRAASGEYALVEEAFCGVLAVVTLEAGDAPSFLAQAVPFVNDRVEGTLSATLLVDPSTADAHAGALEAAVLDLRYGSVGINVWSGVVFVLGTTTWGAYPGHTPADVGSGIGAVHNSYLFDHPEKSVVRAPFRMWPTPVWFADHRALLDVGRRMTAFEARPAWAKLPGVFAAAVRG